MLPGAPTLYQTILNHPDFASFDLSSLRLAVTGAAAIPVELILRMRRELGFENIITGYGLTESCGIATMCRYDDDPEIIATTSGRAIPELEVRCVDPEGVEVPRGEPGELVIRGYAVMRGYLDDESETAATIDADGWLHTGDIAEMDEAGYVRITDRTKDMFIVGGFNAYPAEIENLMLANQSIAQVAVIGIPDERMGEVGMAFVVPRPGCTIDPDELIAWSRERMANYKAPRRVEVVDALPLTASGKVVKFELRARVDSAEGSTGRSDQRPPVAGSPLDGSSPIRRPRRPPAASEVDFRALDDLLVSLPMGPRWPSSAGQPQPGRPPVVARSVDLLAVDISQEQLDRAEDLGHKVQGDVAAASFSLGCQVELACSQMLAEHGRRRPIVAQRGRHAGSRRGLRAGVAGALHAAIHCNRLAPEAVGEKVLGSCIPARSGPVPAGTTVPGSDGTRR